MGAKVLLQVAWVLYWAYGDQLNVKSRDLQYHAYERFRVTIGIKVFDETQFDKYL